MSTNYQAINGRIIAPDGTPFVARGIDVLRGADPSVATLQADFPGLNFIRYAVYGQVNGNGGIDYPSAASMAPYINQLTAAGYVVEIEDHTSSDGQNRGGGTGTVFTGQELTDELNAFKDWGSTFKSNAKVWFGTNNEPPVTPSVDALASWQLQTEQALRSTGNTAPLLLEPIGWSTDTANLGYPQAVASQMVNTVWDLHYYAWTTGGSTDNAYVAKDIATTIANLQKITGANGNVMPIIIGETGNSGDGQNIDPNEATVLHAVETSGVGSAAWAFGVTNPADGLTNYDGSMTDYGREVAGYIKANADAAPKPVPVTPPAPVTVPSVAASPSNTMIVPGGAIVDAAGNRYTIAGGQVAVNGVADKTTTNVIEMAYVGGKIYQENASKLWWNETGPGAGWQGGSGVAASPLPPPTETISLRMSEDAYKGDAQFTVSVDGTQVGGVRTVHAIHGQSSETFDLTGLPVGTHKVAIAFTNDLYGGSAGADRNLYLDSMAVDGVTKAGTTAQWLSPGSRTFTLGPNTANAAVAPSTIKVNVAGDSYQGDAEFTLSVDGKPISMPQSVTAQHNANAWQQFSYAAAFTPGNHTVAVTFTNDLYAGSAAADRNLYVNGIDINGVHYGTGTTALMSTGDKASYLFAANDNSPLAKTG